MNNQIKRRNRIDLCTPAENAIRTAVDEVEKLGAHPTLTDIVNELHAVREKLADYVDAFVKLYSEEPDSVDNSIPIHLNLSFADGLCLDYRNANYSNLCLEDTHGGNIVSRRKW